MAQMPRQTPLRVEHGGEKLPVFELPYLAFGFVAAHLLVERVEQLLAGGGAGKGGAIDTACRRNGGSRAGPPACG